MAIFKGDISDLDEDGSGAGGAAGSGAPSVTPPVGPSPTAGGPTAPGRTPVAPVAPLTSVGGVSSDPLDRVMSAYQEGWFARLKNIGAGGGFLTGVSSVLTGGVLGSYAPGEKGNMQRVIDEIARERSGIDFNASGRVSDIWRRANDQLFSLETKIRVCEEIESTIENYLALNATLIGKAKDVKAAPARAVKAARGEIATAWDKFKAHPITQDMKRVGIRAGIGMSLAAGLTGVGVAAGLPVIAALALSGTLPAGIGLAIRKFKQNPDGSAREGDALKAARAVCSTIREDAEARRDELLQHLERKYAKEAEAQKNTRRYFTEDIAKMVSKDDAAEILSAYEALMQSSDPTKDIDALITLMENKKKDDKKAFPAESLRGVRQSLTQLFSKKAIAYRLAVNESIGVMEVAGPHQMAALVKRISQVNKIIPQSGRELEITVGGVTKKYRITAVSSDPDINLKEVVKPEPIDEVCLKVAKDGKIMKMVSESYEVPTETLIQEMKTKTEDDLTCSDPHTHPPVTDKEVKEQKKLLADAKKKRLSVGYYRKLWEALRKPPEDYEKNGMPLIHAIATGPNDTFEQHDVDVISRKDLIDELSTKTEHDLQLTGNPAVDTKRKQLLVRAQTEDKHLTIAEYRELLSFFRPAPLDYAQNGLPLVHQIITGAASADASTLEYKESTDDLMKEISVKTEHDLVGGTPAEVAEQNQLLADAKVKRLTVAQYKKLWNALKPKPHWARNGLPLIEKIASSPSNDFERVRTFVIATEDLIAEMQNKGEYDLKGGTPSESARQKSLLSASQTRRLSDNEYRQLWSYLTPPISGNANLPLLNQVCAKPTFEKKKAPVASDKALMAEAQTKTESDLKGGTAAEFDAQKQLLADAQAGRLLTVAQYRELWKALKPPKSFGKSGLPELKKIVEAKKADGSDVTEYKFKKTEIQDGDTMKILT